MGTSQSTHEKVKEIEKMTYKSYYSENACTSKPTKIKKYTCFKIVSKFYTHET